MDNNDLPSISALPKDENSWRIDWFGDLAFPNRILRRKQPSLLLHLSRVVDKNFLDDPSVLMYPESTAPANQQRKIWVSVGTLPLLRIGDIWCNGKLEVQPNYHLESFPNLYIDKTTTHLIKAGLNLDEKGFLLPIAEHPWHMQCTHSYCVMVELPNDRRLIIPCIELIRFYFGSSSGLITKLFLPPLERVALYSNSQFDKASGHLALELAEKISGASAADIGRLHLDAIAWRAALHVGASVLRASLAKQSVYPQSFFPFEGKTTLIAAGKWLSFAERHQSTFIVYSLRSCSHPFPFRSLRYIAKDSRPRPTRDKNTTQNQTAKFSHLPARDSSDQRFVERDASNNLVPKFMQVRSAFRFPDLETKAIWKNKTLLADTSEPAAGTSVHAVEQAALGESGSENRIRSIDLAVLTQSDPNRYQPVPEFLRRTVEDLMLLQGLRVELLTKSDKDGWTIPITMLSNADGEIDLRLCLEDDMGILRLRRAAVFALIRDQEHVSAVFIESSPIYKKLYSTKGSYPEDIWQTLLCATNDFICEYESPRG